MISIDPTVIHSRFVESNLNFDKDLSNSVVDSSIASIEFKDVNSDMNNAIVGVDLVKDLVDNPIIMESESKLSLDLRNTETAIHNEITTELNLDPKLVQNMDMNQKQNEVEMTYDEATKGLNSNDDKISLVHDEDRALQEVSENSNSSSFLAVQAGFIFGFFGSIDPSCPRDVSTGIWVNKHASNGIVESENPVFQALFDHSGLGKESKRCSDDEMLHYIIPSSIVTSNEQVRFLELDWNGKKNEHVDMVIDNKKPWVNSFQSNVTKSFSETIVL
ncbi:hypothetical protein L1887_14802 [Cichorium endivia]|nr:hypothetical protein L1887_14802 [Cichorium endivia]